MVLSGMTINFTFLGGGFDTESNEESEARVHFVVAL